MTEKEKFYRRLERAGHKLIRDEDGDIDIWRMDADVHNGPGCELCEMNWCHHCRDIYSKIEKCKKSK